MQQTLGFIELEIEKIKRIPVIVNPSDYPTFYLDKYNRDDWPDRKVSPRVISTLHTLYGGNIVYIYDYSSGYDSYTQFGLSPAMHHKAQEITKYINDNKIEIYKDKYAILKIDIKIQQDYIAKFDAEIERFLSAYPKDSNEYNQIMAAVKSLRNYDILSELKYRCDYKYNPRQWNGQINPWMNLKFISSGGGRYSKQAEPENRISPQNIAAKKLAELEKQSADMDKWMETQIQKIREDNAAKKLELGITPELINDTAQKEADVFIAHTNTAREILGTKNTRAAQKFAYHFLYRKR